MAERAGQARTANQARRLLQAAFPELPLADVRRFGAGWDNVAYLVDNRLLFRFPRHALADRLLRREVALLVAIAQLLPVAVPRYAYVSGPLDDFPYAFAGYELLPGQPLSEHPKSDAGRLAAPLASFVTALQGVPVSLLSPDVPRFTPRHWLARHDRLVETALPTIAAQDAPLAAELQSWWATYRSDPRALSFVPCLIHGDLGSEHILLADDGSLSGIIDFGDAMVADPALDLAGLPHELFAAVSAALGPAAEDMALRRSAYRRLAPLHAVTAAARLSRLDLLPAGLRQLGRAFGGETG